MRTDGPPARAIYAQDLEKGVVLLDGNVVTEVEHGKRWVWVWTEGNDRHQALLRFKVVHIRTT